MHAETLALLTKPLYFSTMKYLKGNFTLYHTGVITEHIRPQNTPIKERKTRQYTRHQILAVR
jgi:hypothetical protein